MLFVEPKSQKYPAVQGPLQVLVLCPEADPKEPAAQSPVQVDVESVGVCP